MICEKADVEYELFKRVLYGYTPSYDNAESSVDHDVNFQALTREEFERTVESAKQQQIEKRCNK